MRNSVEVDQCRPYPELVEPRPHAKPYTIRNVDDDPTLLTRGAIDTVRRVLWVPLAADARNVSRHELMHAACSPRRLPRVPFDPALLATIEDARVNTGLARIGLPVELDAEQSAYVVMLAARDAKAGEWFALFQRCVASVGTSVEGELERFLATCGPIGAAIGDWMGRVRSALAAACDRLERPVAPFRTALALARELVRELRAFGLLDADARAVGRALRCCVAHAAEKGKGPEKGARRGGGKDADARDVPPGRLTIRRVPLAVALRRAGGARHWRASREGGVVRYVGRWALDRAIFRRRACVRGGTLLVDTSGSMSLPREDLDRFLLRTPIGTRVALYAGHGDAGELRIVAEGGRRAAAEHLERFAIGNVVDLPALEWLARQRAPRVWVTDGGVTGIGDRASGALSARCGSVRRRAGIRRVRTLDEAAALFGAG